MNYLTHNPDLTSSVIYGLGWVYLLLFLMNAVWVRRSLANDGICTIRLGGILGEGQKVPYAMPR